MRPGSFNKSLNRSRHKTFAEVRRRAVEHIASEGEAYKKCTTDVIPIATKNKILDTLRNHLELENVEALS